MIIVQEITPWEWPNHTYFLSDDKSKMLGYIKEGTEQFIKFNKPLGFDTRGRKFTTIKKVDKKLS